MSIEQQKTKSERPEIRSLPIEEWPSAERIAWEAACRPRVRLKGGGAATHLRPVTQHMLTKKNGLFLNFVAQSKQLDPDASPGAHVTTLLVEAFVEELKERVSSVTAYGSIQKLRRFTQLIAPHRDLQWLTEIERELFTAMRPKSKWDRVILAEVIIEAGLTLIAETETAESGPSSQEPAWSAMD